jgi:SOS-response transcriptional repressor LexA
MATKKTSKKPALKTPKCVYAHTVQISDDSMAPVFIEGDLVTIDQNLIQKEGDYVLVRNVMGNGAVFSAGGNFFANELHAIRRLKYRGDRAKYVPENPAYPVMLEDAHRANLECLGPVASVRHADGTTETFDLSARTRFQEDLLKTA